jgi:4-hydroxy-3-methylbut-2-enyl diphosphate reductase
MPASSRPRIVVARPFGFCFGVKRAITIAKNARRRHSRVWTLGAIIHNPGVVAELRREGIKAVTRVSEARGGALVIRSHGCPPETLARADKLGVAVIDATCPHVARVQRVVQDLKTSGYSVIIVGERDHPEVQSLLGYARDAGRVYESGMLHRPARSASLRIGVVAQTTIPLRTFQAAVADLSCGRFEELRIFNTICQEAAGRQAAARKIAQEVSLMVVIGGRNSANTSRLADIAREAGKRTYQVETPAELNPGWFVQASRVGVTAGTSTPSRVVDDVLTALQALLTQRARPASAPQGVSRDKFTNRRCRTNAR